MRFMRIRESGSAPRLRNSLPRLVVGLSGLHASAARADWGENWGEMTWGATGIPVPGLDGWGLLLLAISLLAVASVSIARRRGPRMALVLFVALAVPLTAYATTIAMPNVFTNGTIADADEVNDNFDVLVTESNAQDLRISAIEGVDADITAVTAGAGLTGGGVSGGVSLAVDTTAIQQRVTGACAAGSSIRTISAAGTVTCEPDDEGTGDITEVIAGTGLIGGGASGAVTLDVFGIGTSEITDGSIALGDLGFDPTTQSEFDSHAGNVSAHHTRYTDAEAAIAGADNLGNHSATTTLDLNSQDVREVGRFRPYGPGADTNYGTESYAIYQEDGAWTPPYPDLRIAYQTGIKIGAQDTYGGIRFYSDSSMTTETMSVGNGDDDVRIAYNLRAPILFDSNNSAYYVDPAATSKFNIGKFVSTLYADNGIVVDGNTVIDDGGGWHRSYGSTGWYNSTYGGGWYMTDTTYVRSYAGKSIYTSGGVTAGTSVSAPLFYDSNDTTYYANPASTSVLNAVQLAANLEISDSGNFGVEWETSSTGAHRARMFRWSGTNNLYVSNAGASDLTGVYLANGATSWTSTSDRRLKENVEQLDGILEKIRGIPVVRYNMQQLRSGSDGVEIVGLGAREIGSIAQDWLADFSELVTEPETEDGYYGLAYERLGVVAIGAAQELLDRVEALEQQNTQQQNQLAALEARLQQLEAGP